MTRNTTARIVVVLAGLMGAAGVALAAAASHQPDASARLGAASSMLLFHSVAAMAALALADRGILHQHIGIVAISGFILGTTLFAGDLTMRQYAGQTLFAMAAPTGGTLLIASWLVLALAAAWPRRN